MEERFGPRFDCRAMFEQDRAELIALLRDLRPRQIHVPQQDPAPDARLGTQPNPLTGPARGFRGRLTQKQRQP